MAYNYSPIKKIYVKNFRNIGEAIIDFSDSPIVSLIGENESGKTSIVKAFSVCALHSTPRDQKDFIRDGTDGFGVAIELCDGTIVTRVKRPSLNWYSVKNPDGTEWNTSKIDSGLPIAVQKVMGLIEESETKEFLQVRTYEDQLLFVVTPASTNYKVMYDALKVDQLTRAIKIGSKEANTLKSEIDNNESGISTLTSNLRQIRIFDIQPLLNIKHRIEAEMQVVSKIESAVKIFNMMELRRKQIGSMNDVVSGKAVEISEAEASTIVSIQRIITNEARLVNRLSIRKKADTLSEINTIDIFKLNSIVDKVQRALDIKQSLGAMIHLDKAVEISSLEVGHIDTILTCISNINRIQEMIKSLDISGADSIEQSDIDICMKAQQIIQRVERRKQLVSIVEQVDNYCSQVENYIKSLGAAVETCPKCGETIIVDMDKFNY